MDSSIRMLRFTYKNVPEKVRLQRGQKKRKVEQKSSQDTEGVSKAVPEDWHEDFVDHLYPNYVLKHTFS